MMNAWYAMITKKAEAIQFIKMHGLGNDFAVINTLNQKVDCVAKLPIAKLADRHFGIGFDQMLIIYPPNAHGADYFCRIYNADGKEAYQCGNGLRCVARALHEESLCGKNVNIETKAGIFPIDIKNYNEIQIELGIPEIENLSCKINNLSISLISLGNPHAILKVPAINDDLSTKQGLEVYHSQSFPQGINVGLVEVIDPTHIALRTIERGTGETYACGSNACAAVTAGVVNGWLEQGQPIQVDFRGGSLVIAWQGEGHTIKMIGPAERVFSGTLQV